MFFEKTRTKNYVYSTFWLSIAISVAHDGLFSCLRAFMVGILEEIFPILSQLTNEVENASFLYIHKSDSPFFLTKLSEPSILIQAVDCKRRRFQHTMGSLRCPLKGQVPFLTSRLIIFSAFYFSTRRSRSVCTLLHQSWTPVTKKWWQLPSSNVIRSSLLYCIIKVLHFCNCLCFRPHVQPTWWTPYNKLLLVTGTGPWQKGTRLRQRSTSIMQKKKGVLWNSAHFRQNTTHVRPLFDLSGYQNNPFI